MQARAEFACIFSFFHFEATENLTFFKINVIPDVVQSIAKRLKVGIICLFCTNIAIKSFKEKFFGIVYNIVKN